MILATRITFIDERNRKTCTFTQNRLNDLLCFSDAPLYHDKFNIDHATKIWTKIWNKQKITSFETLSTITTTLKFSGLNTSPVLRNVSNKRNEVIFIVKKTKFKLSVKVYNTIVSVMFQRFWLLLRWQEGRKEAGFRLLLVRIYEKVFAGLKSLNLTLNQLYLKNLPEETNDQHQKQRNIYDNLTLFKTMLITMFTPWLSRQYC